MATAQRTRAANAQPVTFWCENVGLGGSNVHSHTQICGKNVVKLCELSQKPTRMRRLNAEQLMGFDTSCNQDDKRVQFSPEVP